MSERKYILVIDDDVDLVTSTRAFLDARGYETAGAGNGTEGLAAIRKRRPDLLILDIMMDYDAEGFTLANVLQQDPETRKMPIVVVSSFQEHLEEKWAAFQNVLGEPWPAAALLEKPAKPEVLAKTVEKLLAS
jgi:twitching motility two-component system response regulator PilH